MLSAVFTGIVQHLGIVTAVETTDFGRRLAIDVAGWSHRPAHGESIAVNGCCLTVAGTEAKSLVRFDVIAQSLRMTAVGDLAVGDRVNLEHSVTPTTMLGGHIMQGHVDGVGRVLAIDRGKGEHRIRIAPHSPDAMSLIVDKGSIGVSGVSLTVAAIASVGAEWFEVALIPTTLNLTNLSTLKPGDGVNLEYDYIAKIVANWLTRTRN